MAKIKNNLKHLIALVFGVAGFSNTAIAQESQEASEPRTGSSSSATEVLAVEL